MNLNKRILNEVFKIKSDEAEELLAILANNKLVFHNGHIQHPELYQWLVKRACPSEFLKAPEELITLPFVQFLSIHTVLIIERPDFGNLNLIRQYLQETFPYKHLMTDWWQRSKLLIYLENSGYNTWAQFAASASDPVDFLLLEGSLADCKISTGDLFKFIHQVNEKKNYHGGLYNIAEQLHIKLKNDRQFAFELKKELSSIINNAVLKQILPAMLKGLINEQEEAFRLMSEEMIQEFGGSHLAELLVAFSAACPPNNNSKYILKSLLNKYFDTRSLDATRYLQALTYAHFDDGETREQVVEITIASSTPGELLQVLNYLLTYLNDWDSKWFRCTSLAIIIKPEPQIKAMLEHFLLRMTEANIDFVYELLTARFNAIGTDTFLNDHWYTLVQKDKALFRLHLTCWLNSGELNVYKALMMLCTVRDLDEEDFKLCQKKLTALTEGDKLYIGIKISGFIYTREHLQNLLFSLIENFKPEEQTLMQEIFNVMFNYVIYNYRSILDDIKKLIKSDTLPPHLFKFYSSLDYHYEQYFAQLKTVRDFPELRPDRKMAEHLRFYSQQKFAQEFKNLPQPAWADFGTTVPIHSHRWALRRANEPKHAPEPLSHVEASAEFPSGERLNPIFQETLRHTYQKMKRDEINLN